MSGGKDRSRTTDGCSLLQCELEECWGKNKNGKMKSMGEKKQRHISRDGEEKNKERIACRVRWSPFLCARTPLVTERSCSRKKSRNDLHKRFHCSQTVRVWNRKLGNIDTESWALNDRTKELDHQCCMKWTERKKSIQHASVASLSKSIVDKGVRRFTRQWHWLDPSHQTKQSLVYCLALEMFLVSALHVTSTSR